MPADALSDAQQPTPTTLGANASATRPDPALKLSAWTNKFLAALKGVENATDPALSAAMLRRLVRTGLLRYTDMRDAPEKFFMAHRLLATIGLGGFGVRFTVQFNLFAGSIMGLGGPAQVAALDVIQQSGKLGCFLLTEMQAGVLSGLIVETTADWDPSTQQFLLHTPSEKAAKNWISQGYTAELGVVIADLRVDGRSHGPHPFIIQLRSDGGQLMPGIRVEDMGGKTVANDLDNARVSFDQVRLPKSALLNRFADIKDDQYCQVTDEPMRLEVIGQRLLTGRLAIAEAALISAKVLHVQTERYAESKVCNGLAGETSLAAMPQLRAVLDESYAELDDVIGFAAGVENRLNECLRNGAIPDSDLVDAIAVCKIKCIDVALERAHALRKEVGSYALMHGTGFELMDMFLCCKFAEGDSRILQQKLARDRLKRVRTDGLSTALFDAFFSSDRAEASAALSLARKLAPAGRDLEKLQQAMDTHWREIYDLADLVAGRHFSQGRRSTFPEPCVPRLAPASTAFDLNWKNKVTLSAADLEEA